MTLGFWTCNKCGHTRVRPISSPLTECPVCKAQYEIVKVLEGAHISHSIPVTRLKGTNQLNVVTPMFLLLENILKLLKSILK